jgi:putative alpha-1,2-mannosidase
VGSSEVSNGNVNPEVSLPWGFNGWSPQTSLDGSWWFYSESHNLYGIRCTKQPSPWIGDYGQFRKLDMLVLEFIMIFVVVAVVVVAIVAVVAVVVDI